MQFGEMNVRDDDLSLPARINFGREKQKLFRVFAFGFWGF